MEPIRRIDPWTYPPTVWVWRWVCLVCGEEGHEPSLTRQERRTTEHLAECRGAAGPLESAGQPLD